MIFGRRFLPLRFAPRRKRKFKICSKNLLKTAHFRRRNPCQYVIILRILNRFVFKFGCKQDECHKFQESKNKLQNKKEEKMEKYEGYNLRLRDALVGVQFLFVAFGALVLVPILTGLDTSVALFTAGVGTLMFQLVTRKNIPPIFLASSFAFIAPLSFGVKEWGIAATMGGVVAAGLFYVVLSLLIRLKGEGFLHKILPPRGVARTCWALR